MSSQSGGGDLSRCGRCGCCAPISIQLPLNRALPRATTRRCRNCSSKRTGCASGRGWWGLGTPAVKGINLRANASRHKAMSYERMTKKESELEGEIAALRQNVDALRMADTRPTRILRFHAGCGTVHRLRRLHAGLPTGAIHIEERDGVRGTIITGTVVREQPLLSCSECGAPTVTPARRDFFSAASAPRSHGCHPRPRALPVMAPAAPIVPESEEAAARSEAVHACHPHHSAARTSSIHAIVAIAVGKPAVEMASSAV